MPWTADGKDKDIVRFDYEQRPINAPRRRLEKRLLDVHVEVRVLIGFGERVALVRTP